ncbi:ATP-binding protein [Nonomuraea sp. NPDC002799]
MGEATAILPGFALLPALRRLDALLAAALDLVPEVYGPSASGDPYRGLVIGPDEVGRLLRRDPGEPLFGPLLDTGGCADGPATGHEAILGTLMDAFALTSFDLDLLVLATAPDLDLRYERLYAYLQDDVTRRRPSVDLALNLLCAAADERIAARRHFAAGAPLLRHGLLHLSGEDGRPLLARTMRVDDQIVRLLIGERTLDDRLVPCARLSRPSGSAAELRLDPATRHALPPQGTGDAARLFFAGPPGAGQAEVAAALAAERGLGLLTVDLEQAEAPVREVLKVAFREAWLQGCAILVLGLEELPPEPGLTACLAREVAGARTLTVLCGRRPTGGAVVVVPFPEPSADLRRHYWQRELTAAGLVPDEEMVERLAGQYRLKAAGVAEAVSAARARSDWQHGAEPGPRELFAAARAQSGQELAALARKAERVSPWGALVLPEDALGQLRELCDRMARRRRVLGEWGFGRTLALGRGICALFAGPSGTGKTMAAGVVAGELGLDLYEVDLATVVSKYIGETEKNLERVFSAAESANAVLFFDEADAIYGRRSEVRDAHDRYANLEIAFLLQRMERYDGIAILATNLRENLDDAFLRRLHFVVEFPMPDDAHRERMWRGFLPPEAPVNEGADDGVDHAFLAREFRLSGGNIKNIVLAAAYLACGEGRPIGMSHLVRAAWREYQKIGRVLSPADVGEYAALLAGEEGR